MRHGNYDEALDLESFVSRMVAAHADDVPVVRALGADARKSSDVMLAQLLGKLRGAIQLPSASASSDTSDACARLTRRD